MLASLYNRVMTMDGKPSSTGPNFSCTKVDKRVERQDTTDKKNRLPTQQRIMNKGGYYAVDCPQQGCTSVDCNPAEQNGVRTERFHCQAMGYCHKTFKWLLSSVQNNGPHFWVHEDDVELRRATNEIYCGCGKFCNRMFKNHICNSEQCRNNSKICHRLECLPTVDFDRRNRKQDVQQRKEFRDANRDHSVPFNPFYDTLPEVDIDATEHADLSERQRKLLRLRNEQKGKRIMISGSPVEYLNFAGILNFARGLDEFVAAVFKRLEESAEDFSNPTKEDLEHERSAVNDLEAEVFSHATKEDLEHERSAIKNLGHVERDAQGCAKDFNTHTLIAEEIRARDGAGRRGNLRRPAGATM